MAARHFLSVAELGPATLERLSDDAVAIARGAWDGREPLRGKYVGLYFQSPSTRTRTSFTVGAMKLGAHTVAYGPSDLAPSPGERLEDTGRALAQYLDVLVVRASEPVSQMEALGAQGKMSVVNAMSDTEHPSQAIADLSAIKDVFGRLEGIHILHLGEGNNTAAAQMLAVAQIPGMRMTLVSPRGYGLSAQTLARAHALAKQSGAIVEEHHRMDRLPRGVDVVYTTRWTIGTPKIESDWMTQFRPYAITPALMAEVSRREGGTVFLHDLRAMRGFEVMDAVLDGPQSRASTLAYHKMSAGMAVLSYCAG
jgi:ornithine carbamoyltransferase